MATKRANKRKQPSGLRDAKSAFKWVIALPAPNAASDGNSNCLRPKMRAKKCVKEVMKVSVSPPSTPIKLSHNDGGIDVNHERSRKSQVKFSPKVIVSSPTTNTTANPTTPPPYSGGQRVDSNVKSSCRRRLDFGSACIQTTTMLIYTKGGFCFTRKVRKYIKDDQQKRETQNPSRILKQECNSLKSTKPGNAIHRKKK